MKCGREIREVIDFEEEQNQQARPGVTNYTFVLGKHHVVTQVVVAPLADSVWFIELSGTPVLVLAVVVCTARHVCHPLYYWCKAGWQADNDCGCVECQDHYFTIYCLRSQVIALRPPLHFLAGFCSDPRPLSFPLRRCAAAGPPASDSPVDGPNSPKRRSFLSAPLPLRYIV